jgi:hypothetical protein
MHVQLSLDFRVVGWLCATQPYQSIKGCVIIVSSYDPQSSILGPENTSRFGEIHRNPQVVAVSVQFNECKAVIDYKSWRLYTPTLHCRRLTK